MSLQRMALASLEIHLSVRSAIRLTASFPLFDVLIGLVFYHISAVTGQDSGGSCAGSGMGAKLLMNADLSYTSKKLDSRSHASHPAFGLPNFHKLTQ